MGLWNVSFESTKYIRMNRLVNSIALIIVFLCSLGSDIAYADNVDIDIIQHYKQSELSWTITNSAGHIEFSSLDFIPNDTLEMELEAVQHFSVNLLIDSINPQDTNLLELRVNNATIMLFQSKIELGEHSYSFYTGIREPVLKIVGGSNANIEDFPWQVYFSSGDYMCGGTIIGKHWILTAAHCTFGEDNQGNEYSISADSMKVKVGTSTPYTTGSGKWYKVKNYTSHSNYNSEDYTYDIAVLELEEDIDYSNADDILLISTNEVFYGATNPGTMATVTGWGLTQSNNHNSLASHLQKVQLPIVANNVAENVWGNDVKSSMIFAGYNNGGKDACNGDSGGPLVVDVDGTPKIVGIVSWGATTCNTYGAYTRVSDYLDWIEEQTGISPGNSLERPQGDSVLCNGIVLSQYTTSSATLNSYQWQLSPDTAGTISFNDSIATVTWNTSFIGTAQLSVRAVIDEDTTSWATSEIEIRKNTEIYSYYGDTIICEDGNIVMEVDADGYDLSYQWYKDSTLISTTETGTLSLVADTMYSGDYYCVVSGSCGEVNTDNVQVTVYPTTTIKSVSEDKTIGQNNDALIEVSAIGRDLTYQWYKDDEAIEGATSSYLNLTDVDATTIGRYNVLVDGWCKSYTSAYIYVYVNEENASATDTSRKTVRIWPSIIDNYLYTAVSNNDEYRIRIYSINGSLILDQSGITNQTQIITSGWSSGIYLIKITSENLSKTFEIVKQ